MSTDQNRQAYRPVIDTSTPKNLKEMLMNLPSDEQLLERVQNVAIEILKVKREEVTSGAKFIDDLGADSLDKVTLLMALEDEFKESISDEEAKELTTVGSTVAFIKRKTGGNRQ